MSKVGRVTVNFKTSNHFSSLGPQPIPCANEIVRLLGNERECSLLYFDFYLQQITAPNYTAALKTYCTFTGLCEKWLVVPNGNISPSGWFVEVSHEKI